ILQTLVTSNSARSLAPQLRQSWRPHPDGIKPLPLPPSALNDPDPAAAQLVYRLARHGPAGFLPPPLPLRLFPAPARSPAGDHRPPTETAQIPPAYPRQQSRLPCSLRSGTKSNRRGRKLPAYHL